MGEGGSASQMYKMSARPTKQKKSHCEEKTETGQNVYLYFSLPLFLPLSLMEYHTGPNTFTQLAGPYVIQAWPKIRYIFWFLFFSSFLRCGTKAWQPICGINRRIPLQGITTLIIISLFENSRAGLWNWNWVDWRSMSQSLPYTFFFSCSKHGVQVSKS